VLGTRQIGPTEVSNMTTPLEFGLDTFGDVTRGADGAPLPHAQVIRNVIDEAVLADELGIDFIGVGEHHRADFAISAPEVVLAAIASRTRRIRLGSSVTVLSSDDPIRVFQRFATVDAASNGRAEWQVAGEDIHRRAAPRTKPN
jgi:alkanesulfonate monooxygenase SsuD/methylene tetrahydromethanopterin reductase-like flavin-dependent oxidoreductase (luciferase family)